jgi:Mce-associated membrane protein
MRWLTSLRAEDSTDTDRVDETACEPVQSAIGPERSEVTEPATDADESDHHDPPKGIGGRISWSKALAYGLIPALALQLASAAGYLKWQDGTAREAHAAGVESVHAAVDGTVALLSYRPDTVEKDLDAAKSRLTGTFLDAYTSLTHDVVIPGAKQKQVSAVATVPAAASSAASPTHAVVLEFVDQAVTVGQSAPTNSASSVRVTLDKVDGRWLISQFDPV